MGTPDSLRSSKKLLPSESLSTFVVSWKTCNFFTLPLFYLISNGACQTVAQYSDQAKNGGEPSFRGRKQLYLQKHSNQRSFHSGDVQDGFLTPPPLTEKVQKIELG